MRVYNVDMPVPLPGEMCHHFTWAYMLARGWTFGGGPATYAASIGTPNIQHYLLSLFQSPLLPSREARGGGVWRVQAGDVIAFIDESNLNPVKLSNYVTPN